MNEMTAGSPVSSKSPIHLGKNVFLAVVLLAAALAGFLAFRVWQNGSAAQTAPITTAELQERYGIRVNLLAVTAAGGLVDLRLKMVDGERAATLLDDPANFPVLVSEGGTVLNAATDSLALRGVLVDGGNLFLIFPNTRTAVTAGMPVMIRFGDILVGPIASQ